MKVLFSYTVQALGIASILPFASSAYTRRRFNVGQEVNTTSGLVQGHAAANRSQVSEYLGIPFAQPPVGDLRFAAPKAYRSSARFNASSLGLACVSSETQYNFSILTEDGYHLSSTAEQYFNTISGNGVARGEDCLQLNVWTKPQAGEKAKAVLLWIHGGGFQGGFSGDPFTTGQYLADEEDVVIISANYRLNVFGFPGLQPEVSDVAPNAGLLDQRLAVEWARDNAAAFGGDPTRITLFGQSAGSVSVSQYGYAYAADPIVHGLITQSGTADSFGINPPNTTASFQSLASILGCSNNTTLAESVACIRSRNASSVLAASLAVPVRSTAFGAFGPTADNRTTFADYAARTRAGAFAPVPRLMGSTSNEGGVFQLEFAMSGFNLPPVFWAWYTLVEFTCPTASAAAAFASAGTGAGTGAPVWRYSFRGDYPDIRLTEDPSVGAYHGTEMPSVFRTGDIFGVRETRAEKAMGKYVRQAWAGFAKDPQRALAGAPFAWPAVPGQEDDVDAATTTVVVLGEGNATKAGFEPAEVGDRNCTVLMDMLDEMGGTAALTGLALGAAGALEGIPDGDVVGVGEALLQLAQASG